MKSEGTTKKRVYIILAVMICVQLASIIYYFQFKKEGYHSDEMWSYGYANSYYMKDIFQDSQGNLTYVGDWYDADILRDYIVVNEGEQFAYDSIYQNQIYDLSPPFHSMVLHTICSFFPNEFSRWFSFSINIVSFIIAMIFLFKSASVLKNDTFALCCCAVYGFSMGARDTFIYLRMYAMCTAFVMVIVYNMLRLLQKYRQNGKLCWSNLFVIISISIMGFLTHYYVVSYMGILTFCVCVYTFLKKEFKFTFGFGFTMLMAFVLSMVIFPAMFMNAENRVIEETAETAVMDYNFKLRFLIISYYMLMRLFGIAISVYPSDVIPVTIGVLCFVGVVSIPLFILLRNTSFVRKLVKRVKMIVLHPVKIMKYLNRRINWLYVVLLLSVAGQIIVVGETSSVYGMGNTIDRYIFYVFPITVILFMALVYQLAIIIMRKSFRARVLLLGATVLLLGVNIYNSSCYAEYLFLRKGEVDIEDVVKDEDCIYIRNSAWMTTTMVPTLMEADEFAQIQYEDYKDVQFLYDQKKNGNVIVILDASIKASFENALKKQEGIQYNKEGETRADKAEELYLDIIDYLENLEPDTEMKHLTTQTIFTRKMEVYLVNP